MKKLKNYLLLSIILMLSVLSFQAGAQNKKAEIWKAPPEADQISNLLDTGADAIKAGKKLYKQQCTVCHGNTGKGDGVAGLALNPKPASFITERFQNETDGAIFWKITNGKPPMAAYKDLLTTEQRWQLVNYIRSFSK